ncbi:hypothetical protein QNH47_00855 [Virgibacillus halodenitrificans]|uniref:hypothetical protein n=1 Tax=Virgibacillus halodenitrificans TaxID=1482 RepID=UPI0024BF6360|nr:hypothetical protein [Virgibacillus halodenitrificans]WHX26434.1 hypothetical protein QNH47_00855 [Virgibacillus halodenitrificans]
MKKGITLILMMVLLLIGCNDKNEGLLSRSQVLELDPNADLIELENVVDWIEEKKLTKGDEIGKVKDGMATKVPEGAIIYEVNESYPILIVEYNGTSKRYLLSQGE